MNADRQAPGELELVVGQRRVPLPSNRPFVLGRGGDVDLDLDHPRVSRRHLTLAAGPSGWTATDTSRNGSFVHGTRMGPAPVPIAAGTTLQLGGVDTGVRVEVAARPGPVRPPSDGTTAAVQGRFSTTQRLTDAPVRIGRAPENDVVVNDLLVSRRHCDLRRLPDGSWLLTDLRSPNGTFVNGQRIISSPLAEGDVVGVGHTLLELSGDRLVAYVDRGANSFEAADLTVTTSGGETILHSVGFALKPNTLLAVIGPSGAGKSTLLNALIGTKPATSGTVRYAGRDLYANYDELRHRIALVPQDDVLHTQLTVRQALAYAAKLRFPADTSADDRQRRIDEVLADLGLSEHAGKPITKLSGGQRKRTSVALELLTKPSLLFLDEPTSGLDPAMDRAVMRTLRGLADDGHTVVVVTHSLLNLDVCDQVMILAPGGHIAYLGPPSQAPAHFGATDYTDIYLKLDERPGGFWAEHFRRSPHYSRTRPTPVPAHGWAQPPAPAPRQQGVATQLGVLIRRYLAVIACDRQYVVFLAVLPVVLSLLARAVPGSAGLSVDRAVATADEQPPQLLLVLIIGASLMGAAAAVRELVKERPIYQRERAIGLSVGAYLTSKILVLLVVTGLQAAAFTLLSLIGRPGPDAPLLLGDGTTEILLAVLALTVASTLTGLLISAAISNADRGMPLLVVLVMVQLILCGGLFGVHGRPGLEQASWIVPARWGFSMGAATTDLPRVLPPGQDPLWEHTLRAWTTNASILAGIVVVLLVVTYVLVRRLDPARRPR